jgi:ATP/ADP translocase
MGLLIGAFVGGFLLFFVVLWTTEAVLRRVEYTGREVEADEKKFWALLAARRALARRALLQRVRVTRDDIPGA